MSLSQPAHAQRPRTESRAVGIGLLGCGTVGGGVARLLATNAGVIAAHGGSDFHLVGVAVRSLEKPRAATLDPSLLTDDAFGLVDNPDVGLIVECIGGFGAAAPKSEPPSQAGTP